MQDKDRIAASVDGSNKEGTATSLQAEAPQTARAGRGVEANNKDAGNFPPALSGLPMKEVPDSSNTPHNNLDESSPSMADLVATYQAPGRPNFLSMRKGFEAKHGDILEEYYARHQNLGAALVRTNRSETSRDDVQYKIALAYDARVAASDVDNLVRAAKIEERRWSTVLTKRNQLTIEKAIFSLIVSLLNFADAARMSIEGERESKAAISARSELNSIVILAKTLARKSTLLAYLAGMVIGAVLVVLLVVLIDANPIGFKDFNANLAMTYSVVCGAVGAVISVMVRVTRGEVVNIDPDQGQSVTVLSGVFRPVVGAIFGTALWVFINGGLIPLTVPAGKETFFFCSLAFLAGFSERWAQDAIVQSAPKLPFAMQGTDGKEKSQ